MGVRAYERRSMRKSMGWREGECERPPPPPRPPTPHLEFKSI